MNNLKQKTNEELKEIMRNSIDNSYVPSSIYNKAKLELEFRNNDEEEIIKLFPEFYGFGLNLKVLWKKIKPKHYFYYIFVLSLIVGGVFIFLLFKLPRFNIEFINHDLISDGLSKNDLSKNTKNNNLTITNIVTKLNSYELHVDKTNFLNEINNVLVSDTGYIYDITGKNSIVIGLNKENVLNLSDEVNCGVDDITMKKLLILGRKTVINFDGNLNTGSPFIPPFYLDNCRIY